MPPLALLNTSILLASDRIPLIAETPMDRSEMEYILNGQDVEFTPASGYSPIAGAWITPDEEVVECSVYNGRGGTRLYRGAQIAYGLALSSVHLEGVQIAAEGEVFAALWAGGSFGEVISRSMSQGHYVIAKGGNLLRMVEGLAAYHRRSLVYTMLTVPSVDHYYSNDVWRAFQNDSWRWEGLTRTTTQPGVTYFSDGSRTAVIYHCDGCTQRYDLEAPAYEDWLIGCLIQSAVLTGDTRFGASLRQIQRWIQINVYGWEPDTCYYAADLTTDEAAMLAILAAANA